MKKYSLLIALALGVAGANAQDTEKLTQAHPSNYRSWSIGLNVANTFSLGDLQSLESDKAEGLDGGGLAIGGGLALTKFWTPTVGTRLGAGFYTINGTNSRLSKYYEGTMMNGNFDVMFNLSNMVLKGKTGERKNTLLFGVGVGLSMVTSEASTVDAAGNVIMTNEAGTVDKFGKPSDPPAIQTYFPVTLEYKRQLSNAFDLDLGARYLFTNADWVDATVTGTSNDQFVQAYVGVTYNFGDKDKKSVVYSNPLDDIYADVEEVKNNFDWLTTDDDKDGVSNFHDKDNSTPEGVAVDGAGRALDADGDGIPDNMDEDPFTAKGATVDAKGRAVDSDGDGVADYMDDESNTPKGTMVNFRGQTIPTNTGGGFVPSVYFAYNSASISAANYERLAVVARMLKANANAKIVITGYADSRGSEEYNKNLGMRRAEAVKKQLTQVFGIDAGRMEVKSEGEAQPLATGRYDINRRADISVK
jgi:OOP family OmpA-OmpF porin